MRIFVRHLDPQQPTRPVVEHLRAGGSGNRTADLRSFAGGDRNTPQRVRGFFGKWNGVADRAPERTILRQVVVGDIVGLACLRKAVDQRADHAEVFHATRQFGGGGVGILHRQRGKSGEAGGALADFFGERVVRLPRHLDRLAGVVNGLHRRRVERQDHHLDAVLVHFGKPHVLDVDQARAEPVPYLCAEYF